MSDSSMNINSQPIPLWAKILGVILLLAAIAVPIIVIATRKKGNPAPPTPKPTPHPAPPTPHPVPLGGDCSASQPCVSGLACVPTREKGNPIKHTCRQAKATARNCWEYECVDDKGNPIKHYDVFDEANLTGPQWQTIVDNLQGRGWDQVSCLEGCIGTCKSTSAHSPLYIPWSPTVGGKWVGYESLIKKDKDYCKLPTPHPAPAPHPAPPPKPIGKDSWQYLYKSPSDGNAGVY